VDGGEALSAPAGPRVRFFAGGGLPPPGDEELVLGPDGTGGYVTGMPWPAQPPFDAIGAYRARADPPTFARLVDAARALVAAAAPAPALGSRDLGVEGVEVDGAVAAWIPDARPAPAEALVAAAREVIAAALEHPWAVARGVVRDGAVHVRGRGEEPLTLGFGDGEVRAGWGPPGDPPSPLELVAAPAAAIALPERLAPGAVVTAALPDPGPRPAPGDAVHALVHLAFRSPVDGSRVEGWLVAGPPA
jgi:hypothetical protein